MKCVRNILLVCLLCAFICGPAFMYVAVKAKLSIPEWLNPESATYLTGGRKDIAVQDNFSVEGFLSKDLQEAAESTLSNVIPARASALLASAAMDRLWIAPSAALCSYDCIPTYGGSYIVYSQGSDALSQKPLIAAPWIENNLERFGGKLSDLCAQYPDKQFVVIVADSTNTSLANPAVLNTTGSFTTSMANEIFERTCSGVTNVSIVDVSYNNPEDYYQNYYTTDHHWNGWGALDAYNKAAAVLATREQGVRVDAAALQAPMKNLGPVSGFDWLQENGSLVREGLMMLNEAVNEPALPFDDIEVTSGDAPFCLSADGVQEMKERYLMAEYDFYQVWYGEWSDTVATNAAAVYPELSALVICDSYGTAFKWIASTGFGEVTTKYDLHDLREETVPLAQTLEETDCDVVFLVARTTSFGYVLDTFPEYMDEV